MTMLPTRRWLLATLVAAPIIASAKNKKKKKAKDSRKAESRGPVGLIGGTVFTSEGRSLPGARIEVIDPADPKRRWHGVSDPRGEFAVRVPAAGDPKYRVIATAKKFRSAEKEAYAYEGQRSNVNLILKAE